MARSRATAAAHCATRVRAAADSDCAAGHSELMAAAAAEADWLPSAIRDSADDDDDDDEDTVRAVDDDAEAEAAEFAAAPAFECCFFSSTVSGGRPAGCWCVRSKHCSRRGMRRLAGRV